MAEELIAGRVKLGGEPRDMTVMCCDIRDYTAFTVGRSPEVAIDQRTVGLELDTAWDRDLSRLHLGIGYRHSAHAQAKVEYRVGDQRGADTNGNRLLAVQFVMWF